MDTRLNGYLIIAFLFRFHAVTCLDLAETGRAATLLDNGLSRTLKHIYAQCENSSEDIFHCFKVQGARLLGRALKVQNIKIIDGLSIVRKAAENETRTGRASANSNYSRLSNSDLERMSAKSLDAILFERFDNLMRSSQIQVNLPRLMAFGQRNIQELLRKIFSFVGEEEEEITGEKNESEGRKKKDDKKYLGPFIAAVLLKAGILKMAYHSIAIVAGKALIVGKIALIISAIIGLKKLVSAEGHEKTTYEIVKHPQVQQSHTYSSSHGEYEGGHDSGGPYHRSIAEDEVLANDKAYRAYVPTLAKN